MRINITEYITRNNRKTIIVAIGIAIMLCVAVGIIMGTNAKKQENNGDNASVEIPSEQEDHNQKREESAENRLVPTQESNEINLSREQIVEKYYAFIEEVKDSLFGMIRQRKELMTLIMMNMAILYLALKGGNHIFRIPVIVFWM